MRKLFHRENTVTLLLARAMELVLLGMICMICCLPVITVGPAVTALFGSVYELRFDQENKLLRCYFKLFRTKFKTTVAAWLLGLSGFAALLCYWVLLRIYAKGAIYTAFCIVLAIAALTLEGLLCYLFPLISRYGNSLREHVRNAGILMLRYFPKTLLMIFIQLLPLLMFSYLPFVMMQTLLFWILLCPGLSPAANVQLLRPVFEKLEEDSLEE